MRMILVGGEYAGTTSVAIEFHRLAREQLGIDLGSIHDHWKIPYTVTHYPDEITEDEADRFLALSTRQREAWQRHNLYYHTLAAVGAPRDQIIVGFYIEDTIYADLYYRYGGPGEAGDRAVHAPAIEKRLVALAPETVLVHVWARPEVIRRRAVDTPHRRQVVPDADVELVQERFAGAVAASRIAHKIELDTSDTTAGEAAQTLFERMEPLLTEDDRARRAAPGSA